MNERFLQLADQLKASNKSYAFIAAGGGTSLANLLTIPGMSSVIDGIYFPWSKEHIEDRIGPVDKFFSSDTAIQLADSLWSLTPTKVIVGISAAIITDRYRRGDNGAYIYVCEPGNEYQEYLALNKWTQHAYEAHSEEEIRQERLRQDMLISIRAMEMALA